LKKFHIWPKGGLDKLATHTTPERLPMFPSYFGIFFGQKIGNAFEFFSLALLLRLDEWRLEKEPRIRIVSV
jgi:hypothetical protein